MDLVFQADLVDLFDVEPEADAELAAVAGVAEAVAVESALADPAVDKLAVAERIAVD